ncbi:major facilitator superfamily domain-containing protein [Ilyonectria robusta]|uniref:major facilitator superfamily domain-containing protein n=1 Tax=Ilyonectria robusta TaxID=1079257 RepID=UPI001E8E4739|nr:major facilitator superfamily domain-containing protein [Ilyonectria robusta]KAH8645576.1 major facilitator superfamily domain-containing protein [Ilyonectria robusta]
MALGVLEHNSGAGHHVPGTVLLDAETNTAELELSDLRKGTGKNAHVILVPQPSNDPNDPLNWPLWQRDCILILFCFCTVLVTGGVGPLLSSMALPIMTEFGITFTDFSLLTGYQLCAAGATGIFISACARKYGKRPTSLFSMSAVLAGCIWAGRAQSYGSLVGARVLQGLGLAFFESVTFAIVGDLFHVHERGKRMAIYVMAQSGIANLPSSIAGKITMDLGWRWVFYLLSLFVGIGWLCCVLFGWETAFNRRAVYNLDTNSNDTATEISTAAPAREHYLGRMKPYHGSFSDESLLKMLTRPFFVLINPAVAWSILMVSFCSVWVIGISLVIAQIFSAPPYLLNTAQLGYIAFGPVIGGSIGCIICGALSDPVARWMTKRNNGIYEPEFRLPLMLLLPFVSTIGYFLFGNLITEGKSPVAAAAMWGVVFVSVQVAAVSTGAYIVDAFRDISVEAFIISMTVKNFLWFGFSYFLNDWLATKGASSMFGTIGGIQLGLSLTTIPMYIYGKRTRAWWHSNNALRVLN